MSSPLVPLEITFPIQGYAVGDIAGFDDSVPGRDGRTVAQRLIDEGLAKRYTPPLARDPHAEQAARFSRVEGGETRIPQVRQTLLAPPAHRMVEAAPRRKGK